MKRRHDVYGSPIVDVGRCEQPTDERECPEAVNSQGRACQRCDVESCYRQGWTKLMVDSDNKRRCLQKVKLSDGPPVEDEEVKGKVLNEVKGTEDDRRC